MAIIFYLIIISGTIVNFFVFVFLLDLRSAQIDLIGITIYMILASLCINSFLLYFFYYKRVIEWEYNIRADEIIYRKISPKQKEIRRINLSCLDSIHVFLRTREFRGVNKPLFILAHHFRGKRFRKIVSMHSEVEIKKVGNIIIDFLNL